MNHTSPAPTLRVAERMKAIEPFYVMEIQRRAFALEASGRQIVHMEIGQPDFGAPEPVVRAVTAAMAKDPLGYTDALGLMALREAISRYYAERYRVDVPPARIVVTAGASGAFLILNGALFNAGEQILLPAPGYPCNRHFVAMFDATPVALPVGAQTAFQPSAAMVASAWTERVKGIVIASPSNPTGTSIAPQELGQVIAAARQRGGTVIVDEIYHGLTYGTAPASTALALSHDLCVVNSFSKYFNLTGWRVGWIVAPAEVVPELERFAQNAFICPPAPAQHAALAALGPAAIEIFEMRREEFRQRRDFLVPALRELGFVIPVEPDGAFYIYADCSRFAEDSFRFAFDVLERAGVAITPGRDFGGLQPERFVRFAYTRSLQQIELAVERLRHYLIRR